MMKELDNKIAVAQFGGTEDPELRAMAETANAHWYVFDELNSEDIKFEIEELIKNYRHVFVYVRGDK